MKYNFVVGNTYSINIENGIGPIQRWVITVSENCDDQVFGRGYQNRYEKFHGHNETHHNRSIDSSPKHIQQSV